MPGYRIFAPLIWIFVALFFGGCGTEGYLVTKSQLAQVKIGESTKEHVLTILGKPKAIHLAKTSHEKKETWTYHLAKYASDPHTGVPPIGVTSWPMTRNRPQPTIIEISFTSSNIVTRIQEHPFP